MNTLRTTLIASFFAVVLVLTGCSAGTLTGPDQQQTADAPVQTEAPQDAPDDYNVPVNREEDNDNTNGDGGTDSPDGYNLSEDD
ncbi:MAG: hypothetical protein BRD45_06300 [Bacteroidetes bacterium QS_8_64_10]|jgi:PBP1b-binding outer membrane lipoprotein LpoB|nr:MAG: hypothetical protein BRD45_06300 [Bacteroidetes bacterium QS_8_64_10]